MRTTGAPKSHLWRARAVGPYVVLFCLGLWARLPDLPYARFAADEALLYEAAQAIANFEAFPFFGPSVSGSSARHPGPLAYVLLAIPAMVSKRPEALGVFVALLALGSMAFIVSEVRRVRGELSGYLAATYAAVAPWPVLYSDRPWGSNLAPWLATIALGFCFRARRQPSGWSIGVALALAVVLPQVHLSSPVLWLAMAAILAPPFRKLNLRAALAGLALGGSCYLPTFLSDPELFVGNLLAILAQRSEHVPQSLPGLTALAYLFAFATGEVTYQVREGHSFDFDYLGQWSSNASFAASWYGSWISGAVVVSALLALAGWVRHGSSAKKTEDPFYPALVASGLGGAALLVLSSKAVHPHYVNMVLGLAIIPAVDGLHWLWEVLPGRARFLAPALCAVLVFAFLSTTRRVHREVDAPLGLRTMLALADVLSGSGRPFDLRFDARPNSLALQILTEKALGRPWLREPGTGHTFFVISHPRDLPAGARQVGALWVVERER